MIYSLAQIADINKRDIGVNGRFYEDVDGYIYIGKGTRLFKYAKCSEVSFSPTSTINANNVCDALNNLDARLVIAEDKITVIESIYATKCFTMAMLTKYG